MKQEKPNVILVITDDQGYGDLGCTGNPVIRTPHIDRLHGQSVRFTDYHVGPTCAPTRAGLMTGHFHNSTGVWHTIGGRSLLRRNEVSLASVFSANGYRTGIFGKWHLGDNYPYRPHDRGFHEAVVHGGGGIGQTPDYWGNDYFDDTYFDRGEPRRFTGYCTDVFFGLAMDFISRHRDVPFFCYLPTNAPHLPLQVEDRYVEPYRGSVPEDRARFYGMIANIDENMGRLRRHLDALGLTRNTVLVFMTDNGTAGGCRTDGEQFVTGGYNADMRGMKGSPYEGGHRVPFFLHYPDGGFDEGRDVDALTANVDFMPGIAELCRLDIPGGLTFDGISFVPLLRGDDGDHRGRALVTDSQRVPDPVMWKDSCVMEGKWRLINGVELYDVGQDPGQRSDLSRQDPPRVEKMRRDYERWWAGVSRQFHEQIPIVLGSEQEKVTDLTSHDWRGDVGDCAWNQGQIRQGKICNGHFEVEFAADGLYRFELRRWPAEEGRAMTGGIPGEITDWFHGGRAISIRRAAIRVGEWEQSGEVSGDDESVVFVSAMKAGPAHLQTFLEDDDGNRLGAYYVYVQRIGE